ncbi:MAG: hypothetical protein M0P74_18100 [Syntrophales bacterium]|nr:hypothetical protein [Syntrophales bacterium]
MGLTTLPAIFVEGNPSEIALVENLLRQDLTSVEEAEALQRLKDEQQYSDEQLSGVIGKARTTVSDIMLINRLPVAIRDECRGDHKIGKNVLIEIARKKQERGMLTAWDTYKDKRDKTPAGRQKRDPNNQAQALDALVKTAAKISDIDNSAWTDDEKEAYRAALINLQTAIESFLNPASALA